MPDIIGMNRPDQRFYHKLYLATILMVVVLSAGIAGFMWIEEYSVAEAFYMTVVIVSTVGLGSVHELSTEGRVFVTILIITSLGIATYAISVISTAIMEGELQDALKYRKVKRKIENLKDHVIVCGYGRNGKEACAQLRMHQQPFVAVESKPEVLENLHNSQDTFYVDGDATRDEVLLEAGIERARALITTLPNDADNVFVVLTARGLNPKLKIISRASDDGSFNKIKRAGADNVIMPDKIGGVHMASLIAKPDVLEFIDVITGRANFDLEEISFSNCKPGFVGKSLDTLAGSVPQSVNIIGIKTAEGNYLINPPLTTVISTDTKLFVLGYKSDVENLIKMINC